jgi:hypothetical protein
MGQIEAYVEALNQGGLNGEITRAGRKRYLLSVERAAPEKGSVHAVVQDTLVRHGWTLTESEVSTTRLMQTSVVHNFSDIDIQSRSDLHRAGANVNEGRS